MPSYGNEMAGKSLYFLITVNRRRKKYTQIFCRAIYAYSTVYFLEFVSTLTNSFGTIRAKFLSKGCVANFVCECSTSSFIYLLRECHFSFL